MNEDLEYSWSNGQYWSKYNHCRVWENGTYTLKVRDKYGQIATATYEVTNNHKTKLSIPTITSNTYNEGEWTSNDISILVTPGNENCRIAYKREESNSWTTFPDKRPMSMTVPSNINTAYHFKTVDDYGNESLPITFNMNIDKSAPTNINFVPTVSIANEIYTTVNVLEDKALPLRYSITYDGGQTWSTPQIGRNFGLVNNPPKGTYTINCRAYNAAGLYVEGSPIQVTIS